MNTLIFPFEPSMRWIFHEVLELEEHNVTIVQRATDVIHILEDASDAAFILIADNMFFNREALALLALLPDRPELRARIRIIASDVSSNCPYPQKYSHGMIDDYLIMPFSVTQLLDCLEANIAKLPH